LVKVIKKKNKGGNEVKAHLVKNHLSIFVNCLIENPAFDSQTKDFLTTRPKDFGSVCTLSEKFLKAVEKSDIVDTILSYVRHQENLALKRKGGVKRVKLTGITKLDDANNAGTAKSVDCTLILTEGDSAKSLAMAGLSVVGRDYFGVFPLKGKLLNVRDATHTMVVNNEEIKNIVDIMGLKFGVIYNEANLRTLRYGHLMVMADQDTDGSHIKGLVINLFHRKFKGMNVKSHVIGSACLISCLSLQISGHLSWISLVSFFNL
jgi:DNA topoisomerase II